MKQICSHEIFIVVIYLHLQHGACFLICLPGVNIRGEIFQ